MAELGGGDLGWLTARHHFQFGGHGNPKHRALGDLIVWNDDELAPGTGFPPHGHSDVEIITYVREGHVAHRDSVGGVGRIDAGDVQVMSAGTGITHGETASPDQITKVFQIWLRPRAPGGEPVWGTRPFPKVDRADRLVPLASGYPEDGEALPIRADARVLGATLVAGKSLDYTMKGSRGYIVPASGSLRINGVTLSALDGAALVGEDELHLEAIDDVEFVLVDVL